MLTLKGRKRELTAARRLAASEESLRPQITICEKHTEEVKKNKKREGEGTRGEKKTDNEMEGYEQSEIKGEKVTGRDRKIGKE